MKKIFSFLICLLFFFVNELKACEIEITVDPVSKKEVYKSGDEVTVIITVTQSHRFCKLDISKTKFITAGLKILAATDWKEISNGSFERKMKLKVLGSANGKLLLKATRKCSKENSVGSIILNGSLVN